jgi:hypothetical protein
LLREPVSLLRLLSLFELLLPLLLGELGAGSLRGDSAGGLGASVLGLSVRGLSGVGLRSSWPFATMTAPANRNTKPQTAAKFPFDLLREFMSPPWVSGERLTEDCAHYT